MADTIDPAIVEKFANAIQGLVLRLSAGAATLASVSLVDPASWYVLERAIKETTGAIGVILIPVVQTFSTIIRSLGETFASLGPNAQKLVQSFIAAGVAITALSVAMTLLEAVMTGGIGPILNLVVGAAAGAAILGSGLGKIQEAFARVGEYISDIADKLMPAFEALSSLVSEVASALAQALGPIIEAIVSGLMPVLDMLRQAFQAIQPAIRPVIDIITGILTQTILQLSVYLQLISASIRVAAEMIGQLFGALQQSGVIKVWLDMVQKVVNVIQGVLTAVFDVFFNVMGQLITVLVSVLKPVFEAIRTVMEAVYPPMLKLVQVLGGALMKVAQVLGDALVTALAAAQPAIEQLGALIADVAKELGGSLGSLVESFAALAPVVASVIIQLLELAVAILTSGPVLELLTYFLEGLVVVLTATLKIIQWVIQGVIWLTKVLVELANVLFQIIGGGKDVHLPTPGGRPAGAPPHLARQPTPPVFTAGTGDLGGITQTFLLDALRSSLGVQQSPQEKSAGHLENIDKNIAELNKHATNPGDRNRADKEATRRRAQDLGNVAGAAVGAAGQAVGGAAGGAIARGIFRGLTGGLLGG